MGYDLTATRLEGESALVIQPTIPDSAPDALKNALAVRRAANLHWKCPDCGAQPQMPNHKQQRALPRAGKAIPAIFLHKDGCGCLTDDEGDAA